MSDLISRQAVIDALSTPHGILYPIRTVEELPPVQPQISGNAVNLCETCKYDFPECPKDSNVIFGDGKGSDNVCACSSYEVYVPPISKREWYQRGYKAGQESAQPKEWIPVTERLPEECGEYLVTKRSIGWNCKEYYSVDIAYYGEDGRFHKANKIFAWMPLPEPYTSGADMRGTE